MDDFKDVPRTLGEIRSDKSFRGKDWCPRDALIYLLREIDNGRLDPKEMIVVYALYDKDGISTTNFLNTTSQPLVALGLANIFSHRLMDNQV